MTSYALAGVGEGSRHLWERPRGEAVNVAQTRTEALRMQGTFRGLGEAVYKKGRLLLMTAMALGVTASSEFRQTNTLEDLFPVQDRTPGTTLVVNQPVRAHPLPETPPRGESVSALSASALRTPHPRTRFVPAPTVETSTIIPDANAAVVPFVTSDGTSIFRAQDGKFVVLGGSSLQEPTPAQVQEFLNQEIEESFD